MKIVCYPNEILLKPTTLVTNYNRDLKNEIFLMFKSMREAGGIGLAANQIGINKSMFVMDVKLDKDNVLRRTFINPVIKPFGDEVESEEGCLSFPDVRVKIKRYNSCTILYRNLFNQMLKETFVGLPAIVCQHEVDHLQGKTFIDNLDELTKQEIRAKLSQ